MNPNEVIEVPEEEEEGGQGRELSVEEQGGVLAKNEGLVQRVVRKIVPEMLREDALQEGRMALLRAAAKYDVSYGTTFGTFAYRVIHNGVCKFMHSNGNTVHVPEGAWRKGKRAPMTSLNAPVGGDESGEFSLMDTLAAPVGEDLLGDDAGMVGRLWEAMGKLSEREQLVVSLRFGEEKQTLEEVGERLGVTRERIRQIEANCLRKLQRLLKEPSGVKAVKVKALPPERITLKPERSTLKPERAGSPCHEPEILSSTEMEGTRTMTHDSQPMDGGFHWEPLEEAGSGMAGLCYCVRQNAGESFGTLRLSISPELVSRLGVKSGELLRLDGDLGARKARLVKVSGAVPYARTDKATKRVRLAGTGRGDWRISYTGKIGLAFPLAHKRTKLEGVEVTAAGMVFELPGRE